MAFIPFPTGAAEILINFSLLGIPAQMTVGIASTSGDALTGSDGAIIAAAVGSWWNANMKAKVHPTCIQTTVIVNDLTSESGWTAEYTNNTPGTNVGEPLPAQSAMVVTFLTGIRGRSYRGRNYVPGITQAEIANVNQWSAGTVTAVGAAYVLLQTALVAAGVNHVVLSRFLAGVPRALGHTQIVESYVAKTLIATQRRRLT